MSNVIRIKRRTTGASGAPSELANAELAFNELNNTLYYGKGQTDNDGVATSIIAIGGDGTFATKTYVDGAVAAATPSGVAYLAQNNTFTAINTFSAASTINIAGAWQVDGATVNTSAGELNVLDGVTAGTVLASKAVVVDASKNVTFGTGGVTAATITTTSDGSIGGNLTVTGNLSVNGTTTTVNSTTITVDDPTITVGGDAAPTTDDNKDRGVEFRWHNGTAAKLGFFGFSDSTGRMTFIPDATNTSEVFTGTLGTIDVGAVYIGGSQISASALSNGVTGTTSVVLATGPTITTATLVTPALGTPTSGTLTSCTGLPISTGVSGLGAAVATFLATPSSANLAGAVTDATGTGLLVFATSPTLVTPVLGTPSSGTLTSCTGLPIGTGVSGLGTNVATFLATPSSANLAGAVTDETGSGNLVFATSPTLVTPVLGTPSSGTLTSCTDLPVSTGLSGLGTNVATFLATPSSANLASAVTDETGSGLLVFGTSPTITTSIVAGSASMNIFNTVATTVNAFGVATALSVGGSTGSTTINNNLVVTGDLTINGTTTTVNSTTVTIDDPIFTLGGDTAPATDDGKDRGIEFRWHNGTVAKIGFFGFDDSTGKLAFYPDATNTSEVFSGTLGTIDVGAVHISGSQIAASDLSNGTTGSGSIVLATSPTIGSPTLTTPVLGTPSSGTLTSCTGLPIGSGVSGLGANVATFLATPTSANLIAAVSDETGTGALVFSTSPSLTTPTIGAATATSINRVAITAPMTGATITVADGKTFTCSNTLTFTGTDSISVAFGAVSGTVAMLGTANAFTGANTFTNATGQTFRPAATQDAIILQGRAGGTSSFAATLTTATLTANRTITFPDEAGTVVTTASVCTAVANCTLDGGTF